MEHYYTTERNIQILISLLKAHNIKRVIASPGATNITFVASVQQDSYFEIYSCVDERSAAYMACGMAAESGEPVVLSCTGATASRNYIPGLTEAYYSKLPILAVTSTKDISKIGQLIPQVIDRRQPLNDIVKLSEHINIVSDVATEHDATLKINRAILELTHRGNGPVHLNMTTTYSRDYSVVELPKVRAIERLTPESVFPEIQNGTRVALFIGSHLPFSNRLTEAVDKFCEHYDAVVFCDHSSGYKGKYRVQFAIVNAQEQVRSDLINLDLLIHLGEVSGDYPGMRLSAKQTWRVSEDGELRDTFHSLSIVFEMNELLFFERFACNTEIKRTAFLDECLAEINLIRNNIPELPFSNTWIAQQTAHRIPENSVVHLGILNSLRNWNYFDFPESVIGQSNTGGFGIDGCMSTSVGASFVNPEKLHFLIIGDLAFFYDMNVLGNRHIGNNIRILLINNGKGTEFRNYNHYGFAFGEDADKYIAAGGHFGNQSKMLIRHFAEDLSLSYFFADTKESYLEKLPIFLSSQKSEKSILFEVFTNNEEESDALKLVANVLKKKEISGVKGENTTFKGFVKKIIGEKGVEIVRILKK